MARTWLESVDKCIVNTKNQASKGNKHIFVPALCIFNCTANDSGCIVKLEDTTEIKEGDDGDFSLGDWDGLSQMSLIKGSVL